MPFRSEDQRKWMHIHHPKMADRWEKHTPKGKKLPKHVDEAAQKWAVFYDSNPDSPYDGESEMMAGPFDDVEQAKAALQTIRRRYPRHTLKFSVGEYGKDIGFGPANEDFEPEPSDEDLTGEEGFENTGDIPENPDLPQPRDEGEEYEKIAPTWALKMDEPFEVETIEGPMDGKAGDYLAQGPEGDMWVVDGDVFDKTYEPAASTDEFEVDDGPAMESVFRVKEDLRDLSSTKPPPGSKPLKAGELNTLGQVGQSAQKGLDALNQAGQDVDAFKTPDGQFMAYPKMGGPNQAPFRADMTKGGLWSPMTGSDSSGSLGGMGTMTPSV